MTPSWLLDLLAAIMLAVAGASAARLLAETPLLGGGPWRPMQAAVDADVAHALMGIAMAGMFTPSLVTLPNVAWGAVFGLATAWFTGRGWLQARGDGIRSALSSRCTLHLIHSAAMLYMFLALAAPGAGGGTAAENMGGSAMATLHYPTLAGVFTLLLIGYSVWDLDQLSVRRFSLATAAGPATATVASGRGQASRAFLLGPAAQVGYQVVLSVAMALMLVIMI